MVRVTPLDRNPAQGYNPWAVREWRMKRMNSQLLNTLVSICCLCASGFLLGCAARPSIRIPGANGKAVQDAGLDPAGLEKIDRICQRLVDDGNAPGIVLLIGRGNKTLFQRAYGCRMMEPHSEQMTLDTIFDMASVTKSTATASAIMFLVQDEKIALDDPIATYVPEFSIGGKDKITILSLLTHCSGLPAYTNARYLEDNFGPRPNPSALIKRIAELDLQGEVGEKYIYSCLNYLVLARAAQNVLGRNQSDFLDERLWTPLGMSDTTFFLTEEQLARTAPTIYENGELRRGLVHDPLACYSVCSEYAPGNAGEYSTAADLSKYARMILQGGKWKGKRIFKPEIWTRITTNQSPDTIDTARSCGWGLWTDDVYTTPLNEKPEAAVLGHTGYTGTLVWMDKLSKSYIIFLSNCVYPVDKSETKDAVIAGRRRIISLYLDHLDLYKEVRNKRVK